MSLKSSHAYTYFGLLLALNVWPGQAYYAVVDCLTGDSLSLESCHVFVISDLLHALNELPGQVYYEYVGCMTDDNVSHDIDWIAC